MERSNSIQLSYYHRLLQRNFTLSDKVVSEALYLIAQSFCIVDHQYFVLIKTQIFVLQEFCHFQEIL